LSGESIRGILNTEAQSTQSFNYYGAYKWLKKAATTHDVYL